MLWVPKDRELMPWGPWLCWWPAVAGALAWYAESSTPTPQKTTCQPYTVSNAGKGNGHSQSTAVSLKGPSDHLEWTDLQQSKLASEVWQLFAPSYYWICANLWRGHGTRDTYWNMKDISDTPTTTMSKRLEGLLQKAPSWRKAPKVVICGIRTEI